MTTGRLVEFYAEMQGRPLSRRSMDLEARGPSIPPLYVIDIVNRILEPYAVTNIEQEELNFTTSRIIKSILTSLWHDVNWDGEDLSDIDWEEWIEPVLRSGEADAPFDWNGQNLIKTGIIRAKTSVWHHEHDLFATSLNPGASGATRIAPDSNTIGGWQLNAAGETLYFEAHMEAEWDAVSDLIINAWWEVNVDNTLGADGDTVDLRLVVRYKGAGETAIKTQTVEVATTVGASARYKQFKTTFTIDYDAASNVIDSLDLLSFAINLETDTSEVDDIILNLMELRYATTKPSLEA